MHDVVKDVQTGHKMMFVSHPTKVQLQKQQQHSLSPSQNGFLKWSSAYGQKKAHIFSQSLREIKES